MTPYPTVGTGSDQTRLIARRLDEDVARISPLKHANLNLLGRYTFCASTPAGGGLRPLRDPAASGRDDEDDGAE